MEYSWIHSNILGQMNKSIVWVLWLIYFTELGALTKNKIILKYKYLSWGDKHIKVVVYIYIYIWRERKREKETETEKD